MQVDQRGRLLGATDFSIGAARPVSVRHRIALVGPARCISADRRGGCIHAASFIERQNTTPLGPRWRLPNSLIWHVCRFAGWQPRNPMLVRSRGFGSCQTLEATKLTGLREQSLYVL